MKFRRSTALLLGTALALTAAACGGGGDDTSDDTTDDTSAPETVADDVEGRSRPPQAPSTTVEETTTTAVPLPTAPLTGLPVADPAMLARPALAVKMDNHKDARPHAGLNQADVVYEEIVEGITRFFVIFHSADAAPDRADPLCPDDRRRSAQPAEPAVVRLVGWKSRCRQRDRQRQRREPGPRPGPRLLPRPGSAPPRRSRAHADEREHATLFATAVPGQGPPPQMFEFLAEGESFDGESGGGDLHQAEQRAGDLGLGRRPGAVDPQRVQRNRMSTWAACRSRR